MRIVFVGAVDFSAHCLEEVLRQEGQIVGILNPERGDAARSSDYADRAPIADSGALHATGFAASGIRRPLRWCVPCASMWSSCSAAGRPCRRKC